MDHVLKRTYFSRQRVTDFLDSLIQTQKLVGPDPCSFWRGVQFLDVQSGGDDASGKCWRCLARCCKGTVPSVFSGAESDIYIYLDDAIFTGNRVRRDVVTVGSKAPSKAKLHIVCIALHRVGGTTQADILQKQQMPVGRVSM